MGRLRNCVFGIVALSFTSSGVCQTYSGDWHYRSLNQARNNCVLKLQVTGIGHGDGGASAKVTGTGVEAFYAAGVIEQDPSEDPFWFATVKTVEIFVGGSSKTAQVYPLETDPPTPIQGICRQFRFDSTVAGGSVSGTTLTITLKGTFHLDKFTWVYLGHLWVPIKVDEEDFEMELPVSPVVFNVGLANATQVDATTLPTGWTTWQGMNDIGSQYYWAAVSQDMASAASSQLPQAGYAMLNGDLHAKSDLVLVGQGDPLTKLMRQSTVAFNSSHGTTSGVSDKDAEPSNWVNWADINATSGSEIVAETRDLKNRFAFLYSCLCGVGSGPKSAFHHGGTEKNVAIFGLNDIVMSTLKAGDRSQYVPYNNANGDLIMVDKLTLHVEALLGDLAAGGRSELALAGANFAYPPRTFGYGEDGINYMQLLNMNMSGDNYSTLCTIYRHSSETNADWVQFGDWGLVKKAVAPMPEGMLP